MYCLNASTGGLLWSYFTGDLERSSPAVANGKVYIGSFNYKVYCFGVENHPPNTPTITGPAQGKIKVQTTYNVTTTDPDGDHVYYLIDWGDGANSSWIGDYPSGQDISKPHTWMKKGTYTIKAKAKDTSGAESDWGTLTVTMPLLYEPPRFPLIHWLLDRFPNAFPILRQLME